MIHMKQLTSKEEWAESYPIMSELRTELDIETYLQRLEACVQKESYMLFALYENTAIRALCGALPRVSIHKGEHLWIADLVTTALPIKGIRQNAFGLCLRLGEKSRTRFCQSFIWPSA